MIVIRGLNNIKKYPRAVVALGVFDGVHRGHISVLKAAVKKARAIKGKAIVFTFWPHPRKNLSLYSLEHRLRLIGGLGVDVCAVINFNRKFARIPAADFITDILVGKLGVSFVYVGKNFRFGKGAKGTCKTLIKFSKLYSFKVKAFKEIKIKNKPVSSTYIRGLITKGNIAAAAKLLSRPVSILGTVVKGASFGRTTGFPTANIDPHHEVIPPDGVYAVRVIFNPDFAIGFEENVSKSLRRQGIRTKFPQAYPVRYAEDNFASITQYSQRFGDILPNPIAKSGFKAKKFNGACYIGPKPEFLAQGSRLPVPSETEGKARGRNIEVHIFDFNRNIYGQYLELQFVKKIRDKKKFTNMLDLAAQIKKDTAIIKKILLHH